MNFSYIKNKKQKEKPAKIKKLTRAIVLLCMVALLLSGTFIVFRGFRALESDIMRIMVYQVATPIEEIEQKEWLTAKLSMYNAGDVAQTDSSPCIGASGDNICELIEQNICVCAFNQVPLRTILFIDGFGECIVLDRTAKKYAERIDLALSKNQKQQALNWGLQKVNYRIIK